MGNFENSCLNNLKLGFYKRCIDNILENGDFQ